MSKTLQDRKVIWVLIIAAIVIIAAYYVFSNLLKPSFPSAEDILTRARKSQNNVKTYEFNLFMKITVKSSSGSQSIAITGKGEINKTERAEHLKMFMEDKLIGETYLINDTEYVYSYGVWKIQKIPYAWSGMGWESLGLKMLNSSKTSVKGVEKIKNGDAYKVEIQVPRDKLKDLIMSLPTFTQYNQTELNKTLESIKSFKLTIWVLKNTFYIGKANLLFVIASNIGGSQSTITIEVEVETYNFNSPITISFPKV